MKYLIVILAIFLASCGGGGTASNSDDSTCTAGQTEACTCVDGSAGTRTCASGVWSNCVCSGSTPAPATNYVPKYNISSISENPGGDTIIGLDDGTYWEVTFGISADLWLEFQDVVVCGFDMVNCDNNEGVNVTWDSGISPFMCELTYRYTISEIQDDGGLIILDDDSEWVFSSFDALDVKWWSTITDTIVVTSDGTVVNLDKAECVVGSRRN